jgi:hypothetical protein
MTRTREDSRGVDSYRWPVRSIQAVFAHKQSWSDATDCGRGRHQGGQGCGSAIHAASCSSIACVPDAYGIAESRGTLLAVVVSLPTRVALVSALRLPVRHLGITMSHLLGIRCGPWLITMVRGPGQLPSWRTIGE